MILLDSLNQKGRKDSFFTKWLILHILYLYHMFYDLHMQTYATDEHYILVVLLLCFSLMLRLFIFKSEILYKKYNT